MIVKGFRRTDVPEDAKPTGFDDFDLRLGDLMRGERATMGKSLLDVQRELKIKAAYIAAIETPIRLRLILQASLRATFVPTPATSIWIPNGRLRNSAPKAVL